MAGRVADHVGEAGDGTRISVEPDTGPVAPLVALTRWVPSIPQLVVAGAGTTALVLVAVAGGVATVATGRRPSWHVPIVAAIVRQRVRAFSYFFVLRPSFPALPRPAAVDDGRDAATAVTVDPREPVTRTTPLVRAVAVVPRLALGIPVAVLLDLAYPVLMVVVAVSRGWPGGTAQRLARLECWVAEVLLYGAMASDRVPALLPRSS